VTFLGTGTSRLPTACCKPRTWQAGEDSDAWKWANVLIIISKGKDSFLQVQAGELGIISSTILKELNNS
jgi:hypothetical protein